MKWKLFNERWANWELWPFWMRYFTILPAWLWYCIRSGSFWFFTPSNPTLTFGGFEGEDKREMYNLLQIGSYPKTIYISPLDLYKDVQRKISEENFTYPFCVKPDVGMKGLLFRKVDNEEQLKLYHNTVPVEYLVQELIQYPIEASVFYYRYPNEQKGVITGFIQKELMEVVGNGKDSLLQLILTHPKARYKIDEMKLKHADNLDKVIADKQKYFLTHAANLNRGAKFINLRHLISDRMLEQFDRISHESQFYYGRYDLKCKSLEGLINGNFIVLEFNGSGAEPNHVYNAGYTLWQAQKEFLMHWKVLFRISRYNAKHKVGYWPFLKGWKFLRKSGQHLKLLEEYDTKILF